jgi:predicted transcriptional regulator of viral defense system
MGISSGQGGSNRVAQLKSPRGAKTEQIEEAVKAFTGTFTLYELERTCMGVSRDMVRKVLRNLQKAGLVECLGRGPGAVWRKRGNTLKKGQ